MDPSTVHVLAVPKTSAQDDVLRVVAIGPRDGDAVTKSQLVAEIEGAKAVTEVFAEACGAFYAGCDVGAELSVGDLLGVVVSDGTDPQVALTYARNYLLRRVEEHAGHGSTDHLEQGRFSEKAAALLHKNGIDVGAFPGLGPVTVQIVEGFLRTREPRPRWQPFAPKRAFSGRIVIVGAGRGAHQLMSVARLQGANVIGILDDDESKHGTSIMGTEVIGPLSVLADLKSEGRADSVICSVSSSIPFRRKVRGLAKHLDIRLANAIHPTAHFDEGVKLGDGNYIGPFCYIGAETTIGDNCFFSSRTTIEHHNVVGNEVTTGPNVATSGSCIIGNGVKFAAGIVVENRISIGEDTVIASGVAITTNIPRASVVKSRAAPRVVRQRP